MKTTAGQRIPILALITMVVGWICSAPAIPADQTKVGRGAIRLERITTVDQGGQAYRLVYHVNVPPAVFWKFKTDFDNAFVTDNRYIREHHFIRRNGNDFITENKYTAGPDVFFRWRTRVFPREHRLDFTLLNPQQCNQDFHYGTIRVEPENGGTRVTQVTFFDFWGATFWAHNPWKGGMRDFLTYTARWEQETALRFLHRYSDVK